MYNDKFKELLNTVEQYLNADKKFIENHDRMRDVMESFYKGNELFKDATIEIYNDPLQLGSLIIQITDYQLDVSAQREIKCFNEIVSKADNFAFFPKGNDQVELTIMFNGVYSLQGK